MKTTTLYIGDKLEVLTYMPCAAGLDRGEIVEIVDFDSDGYPMVRGGNSDIMWFTHHTKLFHHYKKVKKGAK